MQVERVIYMLMAQEMERALAFYKDVMGLRVLSQSPGWSELAFGDAIIALHGGGTGELRETGLSFQVKGIDSACAQVASGGGKVTSEPTLRAGEGIKLANVVDTEGNGFTLSEYVG